MGIVKRDGLIITVLSYAGVVVGYVNKILLFPNFLSEEQVGLTSILLTLALMFAQFAALGTNSAVVKYFPVFRTIDKRHNGLFFWSFLTGSAGFLFFTLLFVLFRQPVMDYFADESPLLSEYYLWVIPLALATLFYYFFNSWLQALHKTVVSSFVYDVVLRLLITAEITLYALGFISFGQFMVWYVVIYSVPAVILLVYMAVQRAVDIRIRINLSPRTRQLLSIASVYGFWQFLGSVSIYAIPVIDQTMLAGMKGLAQGGIYAIMTYMVSAMVIPYRSLIKVSTPLVAVYWNNRDMASMSTLYRKVSVTNLIAGCFFFLVIWVNLDNIFGMMPESYSYGRYVFLFLGIGHIFDMYAGLNGTILCTSKKYRYDLTFSILLIAFTIITNMMLIPRLGMTGAAIATAITLILYNVIRIVFVRRFYKMQPFALKDLLVAGITAAAILLSSVIPYLGNFFVDAAVRTISVSALFSIAVYLTHIAPDLNQTADSILHKIRNGLNIK